MNGPTKAPAGAPLAAHFETKRRLLVTLQRPEERGEKVEEATLEEVVETASKSKETGFKFDFCLADEEAEFIETRAKKRRRRKKRRLKNKLDNVEGQKEIVTSGERLDGVSMMSIGTAKDKRDKAVATVKTEAVATSSFVKLRKATGTESEMATMHLRYGQGRRNLVAMKQREQRKKTTDAHPMEAAASSNDFKFNFST